MRRSFRRLLITLVLGIWWLILSSAGLAQSSPHPPSGYLPHRVYDTDDKRFIDFEALLAQAVKLDLLLVGEQHDDPATHRVQLALLEGVARRRSNVVLGLEMFERDVQSVLDDYLKGKLPLADFLTRSRPWKNFMAHYHPLVEFAKAKGWPVIASNAPRASASLVAQQGLTAIDRLPAADRRNVAGSIQCPRDDYYKRFVAAMRSHPGQPPAKDKDQNRSPEEADLLGRMYQAQCLKDETMAESIVSTLQNGAQPRPLIIHINGAFHSDYRLGITNRVMRRQSDARVKTVSIIPTTDLDMVEKEIERKRADYLIFVLAPAPNARK